MAWQKDKGFKNFVCAHSTVRVYLPFSMTGSLFREGGCSKKRLSFSLASRNATTYTGGEGFKDEEEEESPARPESPKIK